jgi:hypothetical protein
VAIDGWCQSPRAEPIGAIPSELEARSSEQRARREREPPAEPAERQPRPDRKHAIAAKIRSLRSRSDRDSIQFYLETGKVLIEGLHSGKLDKWRSRRRSKKDATLRAISELLGGRPSASALYSAGCSYVLTQKHPCVLSIKQISATHLRIVAGLADDRALPLLELASREAIATKTFRDLVSPLREPGKGGRRRIPAARRQIQTAIALPLPRADAALVPELRVPPATQRDLASGLIRHICHSTDLAFAIARDAPAPTGRPVLLIDAIASWRRAVGRWLDAAGYCVHSAATGVEAPGLPTAFDIAVVAEDRELARRLLAERRTKRVVILTDSAAVVDRSHAEPIGLAVAREELPSGVFKLLDEIENELLASERDEQQGAPPEGAPGT